MELLVIDDNKTTLQQYKLHINRFGHLVHAAENGIMAWDILKKLPVDIVITDWIMPQMNGLDLCKKIRDTNFKRYIYIIIVSAETDKKHVADALYAGADDYITKPINFDELKARINIGSRIISLEKKLQDKYKTIKKNYFQTLQTFVNLIEVYNKNLGSHSQRVGNLAIKLAKMNPNVPEEDYELAGAAGLLHDIGIIGLPNKILSKKRTELNADEKLQYLSHPVRGEIIFNEIEAMRDIARLIRSHHEQFNGRGFPDGLSGDKIPLLAQIVSAASIYDNIIHKGGVPLEKITEKLHALSGYQLAPPLVDQLFTITAEKIREENEKKYLQIAIENLKKGMILADAVRMKTGSIIIPAETILSDQIIKKLQQYRYMGHFGQYVFISK